MMDMGTYACSKEEVTWNVDVLERVPLCGTQHDTTGGSPVLTFCSDIMKLQCHYKEKILYT